MLGLLNGHHGVLKVLLYRVWQTRPERGFGLLDPKALIAAAEKRGQNSARQGFKRLTLV